MRTIGTLIVLVSLLLVASIIFIYSGLYNVAATQPHSKPVELILHTALEKSVSRHAEGITVPSLSDDSMVQTGFIHYKEMCVTCHGAPGVSPSEIGKGLNPEPPDLIEELEEGEWSTEELFWITKHGIKMSGMPAFGPTHNDEEIWAIIAFLGRLPDLSPEEYQAMEKAAEAEQHEHGHTHEHGQNPKEVNKEPENLERENITPGRKGKTHTHEDGAEHQH